MADQLRERARDRLVAGALPRDPAAFTLAGSAAGSHRCAVCDEVIAGAIEFRLRFPNHTVLHFHAHCHDAWMAERQALEAP
jgi:hypothetical protein